MAKKAQSGRTSGMGHALLARYNTSGLKLQTQEETYAELGHRCCPLFFCHVCHGAGREKGEGGI